ncbi:MAG: heme-dependent oxidative N-demethylase family protein [Paracoccaceae bacterium]
MILQTTLPYNPLRPMRLPGVSPLTLDAWLRVDDAYAGQMALRAQLLATHGRAVLDRVGDTHALEDEALRMIVAHLPAEFAVTSRAVTCPDGRVVVLDSAPPLEVATQIIQDDICLLIKPEGAAEHILTAASLCFPASWRLSEKLGRALVPIHAPVASYGGDLAVRVQRLFDGLQPGRPLWRFNALWYDDATLYQPRSSQTPRDIIDPVRAPYLRSERQCLVRLPVSGGVIFSIHTYVVPTQNILTQFSAEQRL